MRSTVQLIAATAAFAMTASAADWPQYRGPNRDDVSKETGLLKSWPAGGPALLWTFADAGVGYSGPAVVGDRLYLTGGRGDTEYLFALDIKTATGDTVKELWAVPIGPTLRWKGNSWSAGPSATPTVDGDAVFAVGGTGELICVETAAGKERWRVNMPKDLGGQVNPIGGGPKDLGWGFTASPLVDGDHLICAPGGSKGTLAALDKRSGKVVWRSTGLTYRSAYASPMSLEVGGVRQLAMLTNEGLAGVAAKDGRLLWSYKRTPPYGTEVVNSPIVQGDLVYTTVGAGAGCDLVQIKRNGDEFQAAKVYANKNLANHHANVVLVDGRVFGFSERAGWVGQDFKTGDIVWSERAKLRAGSVTFADGRLYCFSEDDGTVALIEASGVGWKETGRFKLPKATKLRQSQGKIWTPPVVAGGRLFLRDQDLLFCFDVKGR